MSYCPKCGTQIPESSSFCPKCGFSVANSNAEPDFDFHYYEKKRKEKIEENEKNVSRINIALVIFAVASVICLCCCNGGFWRSLLFGFGATVNIWTVLALVGIRSRAKGKIKKWSNLTAHDLYIDEKKDAQDMANLANGLKAVNTGMKIGQFFGGF